MVLNDYRDVGDRVFGPVAELMRDRDPNTLTWLSLGFALVSGMAFAISGWWPVDLGGFPFYWLLFLAAACAFINGGLDVLDGKVARITGKVSARGDFLDHVIDRVADVLMMGGIMLSAFCDVLIGATAIIVTLLVSYMGTQAQAVGCGRNYGGIMGRADRMVMIIVVPLLQLGYNFFRPDGRIPYVELTFLDMMMLIFIVTGIATVFLRGKASWDELGKKGKREGE
jgi:phosphatidylglycerophosphate synthase